MTATPEQGTPGLTLTKITDTYPDLAPTPKITRSTYPAQPLVGHRLGLRMNDLATLASAFSILSYGGGTAYLVVPNGKIIPNRF